LQNWYVAKTKPSREASAAALLAQRDVEAFLPLAPQGPRGNRRATTREILFPGYLFVHMDIESDEWLRARAAPGIAYFLGSAGRPSTLPEELIESIRLRTGQSDGKAWRPPYDVGEAVVIKNGPFAGLDAVFDSCLAGRGRVRVLLELVQRLVPVDLDVSQLARAS